MPQNTKSLILDNQNVQFNIFFRSFLSFQYKTTTLETSHIQQEVYFPRLNRKCVVYLYLTSRSWENHRGQKTSGKMEKAAGVKTLSEDVLAG